MPVFVCCFEKQKVNEKSFVVCCLYSFLSDWEQLQCEFAQLIENDPKK